MKIAILGAGAMGSLIGAHLTKGGAEVVLVDPYQAHMEAIRIHGLEMTINGKAETVHMKAVCTPEEAGAVDLVIVLVKGMFTKASVENARALFTDKTCVATLQNGIGNDDILCGLFPAERVIKGVLKITSQMTGPGKVKSNILSDVTAVHLGWCAPGGPAQAAAMKLAEKFHRGGLKVETHEHVDPFIWGKAVNNIAINAACGIARLNINNFCAHPDGRRIMEESIREVITVAAAKGVTLSFEEVIGSIERNTIPKFGSHLPSTAQDMVLRRPTEVDFLNGAIVRYGRELGIPTPVNDYICAFTHIIQDNYEQQVFQ